jgi:hypothetical protein
MASLRLPDGGRVKDKKIVGKRNRKIHDKSFVFFIPAVSLEFDAYTEIEVLLLVHGCKINLILPKCSEYLSFLLPSDQKYC